MQTIGAITPTICKAMGVNYQTSCSEIEDVLSAIDGVVSKCLIYSPDALGLHLHEKLSYEYNCLEQKSSVTKDLLAEMPTVTPVCYASMFTGLRPSEHGITKYTKPVLARDTLFDFLQKNGKKVAIVAVENSSIDAIFKNREIDYFSEKYDQEVTDRTVALLKEDKHDFILAYHQEYDDLLHQTTPFSAEALAAAKRHINTIYHLHNALNKYWKDHSKLFAITPDHGAHLDIKKGNGTHGSALPDDLNVRHFFFLD